jgi:hypothetical protein
MASALSPYCGSPTMVPTVPSRLAPPGRNDHELLRPLPIAQGLLHEWQDRADPVANEVPLAGPHCRAAGLRRKRRHIIQRFSCEIRVVVFWSTEGHGAGSEGALRLTKALW